MRAHDIDATNLETNDRNLTNPVVIPLTGGGEVSAYNINELHDGSTYTLPLANSVPANAWILVELPDEKSSFEPLVQRTGSDTISFSGGTDTEVLFDAGTVSVRFVSDGISEWRI